MTSSPRAREMLAERCEAATGPDRELDLAIHLALDSEGEVARVIASSKRGLNQRLGRSWELEERAVHYETWNEHVCWANGSIPVPRFTASLDAAMSLLDPRALWAVGHMEEGVFARLCWPMPGGGYAGGYIETTAATPALALTAACLRALAQGDG